MARPCADRHPEPVPATCRLCRLAATDPRYQRLWGVRVTARGVERPYRPPLADVAEKRRR